MNLQRDSFALHFVVKRAKARAALENTILELQADLDLAETVGLELCDTVNGQEEHIECLEAHLSKAHATIEAHKDANHELREQVSMLSNAVLNMHVMILSLRSRFN